MYTDTRTSRVLQVGHKLLCVLVSVVLAFSLTPVMSNTAWADDTASSGAVEEATDTDTSADTNTSTTDSAETENDANNASTDNTADTEESESSDSETTNTQVITESSSTESDDNSNGTSDDNETITPVEEITEEYAEDTLIIVYDEDINTKKEVAAVEEGLEGTEAEIEVTDDIYAPSDSGNTEQASVVAEFDEDEMAIEEAIAWAESVDGVAYALPDYILEAETIESDVTDDVNDSANYWYLYDETGADIVDAWDTVTCDNEVTVAVIDTGIDLTHEDLVDNILTEYCYDFVEDCTLSTDIGTNGDISYHGTLVSGIIAAAANNGLGGAGVSYNANIIAEQVFHSTDTSVKTYTSDCLEAMAYTIELAEEHPELNIKVINLSLGGYGTTEQLWDQYIDLATEAGILVVAAGGNGSNGTPLTTSSYPSDCKNVLSVTALDMDGTNATWSDFNEDKDISAPGVALLTTTLNDKYNYFSGTSVASPVVAGIAALLFAADEDATVEAVRDAILSTATEIDDSEDDYKRNSTGYDGVVSGSAGAINAEAAVAYLLGDKYDLSDATVSVSDEDESEFFYSGDEKTPNLIVECDGKTLTEGMHYTAEYSNNTEVGTASVTITGINKYTGTIETTFEIEKGTIGTITIDDDTYAYTGSVIEPEATVEDVCGNTMDADTYSISYENNTELGTATICATVEDTDHYNTGSIEETFTIEPATIKSIKLSASSYEYTGSAIEPEVTVTVNSTTLVEGDDYTVSYSDNVNAGTGTVTVEGCGNYDGAVTKTFTITQGQLYSIKLDSSTYEYTGSAIEPDITVYTKKGTVVVSSGYEVTYSDNTTPGTATIEVTVADEDNYYLSSSDTSLTTTFTITGSLEQADISLDATSYVYTGNAIEPEVTVSFGGETLIQDSDYTVVYSNNKAAGTATVLIVGCYPYTDSATETFTITQAELTQVFLSEYTYSYTGSTIKPSVTVYDENNNEVASNKYTVTYANNTDIGTAMVTVMAKNDNYTGSVTETFTIEKATIASITLSKSSIEYKGSAITCAGYVKVKDTEGNTVDSSVYDISYANNVDVGTATITVDVVDTDTYNEGSLSTTFTITPRSVKSASCSADYTYTGSAIEANPSVVDTYGLVIPDEYYTITYSDNTEIGTASFSVECFGNYTGSVTGTFNIVGIKLNSVKLAQSSYPYTGSAIEPEVTVYDKYSNEISDENYTVSYSDNVNAGTATITVTGTGNYTGTVTKTFTIDKASLGSLVLSKSSYTYTGSACKPTVTAYDTEGNVIATSAYTVTYIDNVNVGTGYAEVSISDTDNYYESTINRTFTIEKATLASATLSATSYAYTGNAIKPSVTVKDANGNTVSSSNYTVSYSNNTKVGTATVTITGINNCTGTIAKTFTITKASITSVALSKTSYTYNGKSQTPTVTAKNAAGTTLTKGSDYTVSYSKSTRKNAGTYTITVTGTGNYTGTVKKTYKITQASQSLTVKTSTKTVKYSKVKKAKQTVKAITKVSGAKGTVTYKKTSGSSKLSVNSKTGKITVKKGTKKGTYKIKVKVTSAKTTNYKAASKTVTVTVKVK